MVDHATGYVRVFHQTSLTAEQTLKAKRLFELQAKGCGVVVKHYHSDNGVFNSKLFKSDMELLEQKFTKSGVGAHHQNAVAERAIGYIMSRARRMLFHMAMMWPAEGGSMELWHTT